MIQISYDQKNDLVSTQFKFSSYDMFTEFKDLCKHKGLKYNPDEKTWDTGARNFIDSDFISDMKEFETPYYHNDCLDDILTVYNKKDNLIKKRRKYKSELLKSEPIGNYQIEGIRKLISINSCLLADDVGLGKTFQVISAFNHLEHYEGEKKILIITIGETLYNWKHELTKFSDIKEEEIHVTTTKDKDIFGKKEAKVIICAYTTWISIANHYKKEKKIKSKHPKSNFFPVDDWLDGKEGMLILDESHSIKSRKTSAFKFIKLIRDSFKHRYLMTATPYPNEIAELWSQFFMIDPWILGGSFIPFLETVAVVGKKIGRIIIKDQAGEYIPEKVEKFLERISPYIIRRFKEEVLPNMPKQIFKDVYIEFSEKHFDLYKNILSEKLKSLKDKDGFLKPDEVVKTLMYLSRICSDPRILGLKDDLSFETQVMLDSFRTKDNAKLDMLDKLLEKHLAEKSKVIVWSMYPKSLNLISEWLEERGQKHILLHGEITKGTKTKLYRHEEIEKFKNDTEINIAVISPLVMGTGVNIVESDVAIWFDRNADIKTFLQGAGRNHRATSKKDVTNYILMISNSIEESLNTVLLQKMMLHKEFHKHLGKEQDELMKMINRDSLSLNDIKNLIYGRLKI